MEDQAAGTSAAQAVDVRDYLLDCGACCVGCADVSAFAEADGRGYPRAVSIGVALRPEPIVHLRRQGERPAEADAPTYAALAELGRIAVRVLRERGAQAELLEVPPERTEGFTHEAVAVRAGLAWIGKSSRPVTWDFGSAVRFTTVLTDAELPLDAPTTQSFCGTCLACTQACLAHAPTGIKWEAGMKLTDFFDPDACSARRQALKAVGHDCRYCMSVCPFTMVYLSNCGIEVEVETPENG